MSKPLTPPPFKAFLASNIPSVYDNTLSYYDELTKLIAYLEQQVVPRINENTAEIEKYENGLKELKEYVDHYFDNLDIQEEINNKLDQMAEHGQLAGIIAQFLAVAPVYGYATIADMGDAENLINGTIARVLGNTDAFAGNGAYYKIRTKTISDVADGIDLVELTNLPTLIAERVVDGHDNLTMATYLGDFHIKYSELDKRDYLFISNDGVNFTKIPNIEIHGESSSGGGDPSIIYDTDSKYFMIAYSNQDTTPNIQCFTVMRSKDLINWDEHPISLTLPVSIQGYNKWAPDWFRGPDGKLYVVFSADKTQNGFDFECLITECTDVENLTFTAPYIANLGVHGHEYDYAIRYFNDKYYMVCAEGGILKMYASTDLINFSLVNSNLLRNSNEDIEGMWAKHTEGANLEVINGELVIYFEYYNAGRYGVATYDTTNNVIKEANIINNLAGYKHGSVCKIDNPYAKEVINSVIDEDLNTNYIKPITPSVCNLTITQDTTISEFSLEKDQLLNINANGHTLTITKIRDPYKIYKLDFTIYDGSGKLVIGGYEDDAYSSYSYTGCETFAHTLKTVDFRYNAYDNSYAPEMSGTIVVNNPTITGNIWYKKIGRVVNINIDVTGSAFGYAELIGTLPSEFLAPERYVNVAASNRNAENTNSYFEVHPNGNITIICEGESGRIVGNITYFSWS